jgi:hypothetical protein
MTAQLDLFASDFAINYAPGPIPYHDRIRTPLGWQRCDCGLVFWEWPRCVNQPPPSKDTGSKGGPDLRPFGPMLCWRGIKRLIPGYSPHKGNPYA